jgi:hypothetical protein
VRDRHEDFADAGCAVAFVAHDRAELLRRTMLAELEPLPFPVLVDLDRRAYAAWGCTRTKWWTVYLDPRVWWAYARLLRGGEQLRRGGADTLQLGGDFMVGPDDRLLYARPQQVDDRPPVGELLRRVQSAAG